MTLSEHGHWFRFIIHRGSLFIIIDVFWVHISAMMDVGWMVCFVNMSYMIVCSTGAFEEEMTPLVLCIQNRNVIKAGMVMYVLLWKSPIHKAFMWESIGVGDNFDDDVIKWNIFRVTGHLCGEFAGHWWIPRAKASDAELWYFFDLCQNEWLSKQSRGWWFETPSCPLWRHCNVSMWMHYHIETRSNHRWVPYQNDCKTEYKQTLE